MVCHDCNELPILEGLGEDAVHYTGSSNPGTLGEWCRSSVRNERSLEVTARASSTPSDRPMALKAGSLGDVQTCSGETPSARVLLRFFKRITDPSGNAEQAGIDAIRKMRAQVDVKTSGGIVCMTAVPPGENGGIWVSAPRAP